MRKLSEAYDDLITPVIKKKNNINYNSIINQRRKKKSDIKSEKYIKKTFIFDTSQKRNRNNSNHILIKSKSINEIKNIKQIRNRINNYDTLSKNINQKNRDAKFSLINFNIFQDQYSTEEEIEKLIQKQIIEIYFNTSNKINPRINSIFLIKDKYYYRLNRMYYEQLSSYMEHRVNWELIEKNNDDEEYSNNEQKIRVNFEWKYYSNKLFYKKYKYNSSYPLR